MEVGSEIGSSDTSDTQKLVDEGIVQYKEENYEEALVLFNKAKAGHPGTAILSYYVGMTYKQLGDMPNAETGLKEALHFVPPFSNAYDELISVLYNEEKYAEALEWIGKAEKENVKPDVISYLKGLVLLKTDDNSGAIEALTKAKELNKEISESVDVQLAVAYVKEHQFKEAQSVLDSIIASQPNSEAANFAREFQKTVEKGKELYKEWQFAVGVSYQLDDNVVLLPDGGISGVNITNKSDSAITERFRIDYRPNLGGKWFFNAQYNASNLNYFKIDSHNMMAHSITLTPGYNLQKTLMLSLPLSYNYVFLSYKQYLSLFSAKPTVNWLVAPNNVLQGYAGYERRTMFGSIFDPNENRTGNRYLGSAGYIYTFLEGKGMFNLKYELAQDDTQGDNWKNTGHTFDAGLVLPIYAGVYTVVNGEAVLQDYNDTHTIFGIKRHDKSYTGNISFVWQVLKDMDVSVQYSHTTADSNIYIYQYKRNMYTAGIEYRF
ncbi:MAG: tetratricopeptide repeat protein [Nitrospirae bacterium]|nr:tetratricopeptide repeat protein [Nitrospirota bacterium]